VELGPTQVATARNSTLAHNPLDPVVICCPRLTSSPLVPGLQHFGANRIEPPFREPRWLYRVLVGGRSGLGSAGQLVGCRRVGVMLMLPLQQSLPTRPSARHSSQ
jgi:hypothetical protein